MPLNELRDHLIPLRGAMLDALEELVRSESPSREKPALDALSSLIEARFARLEGVTIERLANEAGGDHLRVRLGGFENPLPPALVLCHYDTVWPLGTLSRMPFKVEGDRASGPGVYDMKASLVLVEFAIRTLQAIGAVVPRPVVVLLTSDEEIGSPTSRHLIESEAAQSSYVLVMEPPLSGGRLKTARKGGGVFTLEVSGRAAHAGVEPEKGVNAVVEIAHQILAVTGFANADAGTTVNVGVVQGGTTSNVVPAAASARVDVRVASSDEAKRITDAFAALRPALQGARLEVRGGFNRPPMERTPAVAGLFERARGVARALGMELGEGSTGGGSDGNLTAALGVPTLDGLGTPGDGAHAETEHILIDALPDRAALLAALLLQL
jgi:glutamate carboxypeptidase